MAKGDQAFQGRPAGSTIGGYTRPRVQIGFDEDQIAAITKLAKRHNRSFTAEVRALVTEALGDALANQQSGKT
jgi:hypothetical protein